MSCGYERRKIEKLLEKNIKRNTIHKSEVLQILKDFAASVKQFENMPGCYLKGQTPPTLSKEAEKENVLIRKFNSGVDEELKKIVNYYYIKLDKRTRTGSSKSDYSHNVWSASGQTDV